MNTVFDASPGVCPRRRRPFEMICRRKIADGRRPRLSAGPLMVREAASTAVFPGQFPAGEKDFLA